MFKLLVLSALLGLCAAYKSYGGSRGGYGGHHSIELPVHSKHDIEVIHTPSHREEHSTHVEVPGGVLPVYMTFKTESSPLYVKQEHKSRGGSYQKSSSHDEPHHLVHEVTKPVIQELREIIKPYRKVIQVIEPVHEEMLTKVHKGESHRGYKNDDDSDSYGGYGKSSGSNGGYHGGY